PTRERPSSPPSCFFLRSVFPPPAASPCFHSHSDRSYWLPCRLGSSISKMGAAISASNSRLSPWFHRDLAVTRTRRWVSQPILSCHALCPSQGLVYFSRHPQAV